MQSSCGSIDIYKFKKYAGGYSRVWGGILNLFLLKHRI